MGFTITGVHHVGLSVSDIKRSFAWYSKMFDLVPGEVTEGSGEDLSRSLQVEDGHLSFAMVLLGNTRIEFLQYHHPEGRKFDRTNADIGSAHLCFEVTDFDATYADLIAKGAVFNAAPVTLTTGPHAGSTWAYLRDPDGIQLEIWQSKAE